MNTTNNKISVKETAFGQDMQEVLIDKQLRQVKFKELDVPWDIQAMKSHLVSKLAPQKGEYPSELRFMYPTYFDSARVLIAECVAEFFLTGRIAFSELDINAWECIDHEIRQIVLTETEADMLLRVLQKVQKTDHDMCSRWKNSADRERWKAHIQAVYDVISQL